MMNTVYFLLFVAGYVGLCAVVIAAGCYVSYLWRNQE